MSRTSVRHKISQLQRVRDHFTPFGAWVRQAGPQDRKSLRGALDHLTHGDFPSLAHELRETIYRIGARGSLIEWSTAEGRTQDQILDLIDQTIARLKDLLAQGIDR